MLSAVETCANGWPHLSWASTNMPRCGSKADEIDWTGVAGSETVRNISSSYRRESAYNHPDSEIGQTEVAHFLAINDSNSMVC